MNFRNRIALFIAIPVILACIVLGSFVMFNRVHDIRSINLALQRMILASYEAQFSALKSLDYDHTSPVFRQLLNERDVRAARLTQNGTTLFHAGPNMISMATPRTKTSNKEYERLVSQKTFRWRQPTQHSGVTLEVEFSRVQQRMSILETLLILLLTLGAITLFALLPAIFLGRRFIDPINDFIEAITRIREGDLSVRLHTNATGELRQLQDALNAMAQAREQARAELQQSIDQATIDLRETLETIEIQNIELDLARKQALKASQVKSDFLANMSHEIRTPLNGIIGFAQLLQQSKLTQRQHEYLRIVLNSSEVLLGIINDILDFSRIEAGKLQLENVSFHLPTLVEEVQALIAPLAREKSLEQVTLIYTDVPTTLIGDSFRIRQVLTNLINNALKFTPKGAVVVRVMLEEQERQHATIRISVSDTGPGIDSAQQHALFDAFSQLDQSSSRHTTGTGLGLAICKRIVEEMQGEIGMENSDDGAVFWFTVKLRIDNTNAHEDFFAPLPHLSALLVEPYPFTRLALSQTLKQWGIQVAAFADFASAQEAYTSGAYHLAVCGLAPTEALGGDFTKWIHWLYQQQLPTLFLCSNAERVEAALATLPSFPHAVLNKPATRPGLHSQITALMNQQAQPPTAPASTNQPLLLERTNGAPLQVLAVDDHPTNLHLVTTFLQQAGIKVHTTTNGIEALEALGKQAFDLVFMDIQMPYLDGAATVQQWRNKEEGPPLPIVALTAHALEEEKQQLLQQGFSDYLAKPASQADLLRVLHKWVATSPTPNTVHWDEALAMERAGHNAALADEIKQLLREDLASEKAAIWAAAKAQEWPQVLEKVHKLHGGCRYSGAVEVEAAAAALETALKNQANAEELTAFTQHFIAAIEALLNTVS